MPRVLGRVDFLRAGQERNLGWYVQLFDLDEWIHLRMIPLPDCSITPCTNQYNHKDVAMHKTKVIVCTH